MPCNAIAPPDRFHASASSPTSSGRLWLLWFDAVEAGAHMLRAVRRMRQRYRERSALAELDDRLLRDIGLTREQAIRESRKWPWD